MDWPCSECIFPMKEDIYLDDSTASGCTPFMVAIIRGRVECANRWIEAGVDVNATDSNGSTALLVATYFTPVSLQVVEWLLEAGADPNISDQDGIVPLHYAARHGLESVTQKLLLAGAHVNTRNIWGYTSLIIAA